MWGKRPVREVRQNGGFGIQILIALLLCAGASRAQQSCAPLPAGLVSWWPGNGNANDLMGASPGTITTQFLGQVLFSQGKVGTAFDFRGANFVEIPPLPLNSFTLEFWLNQRSRGTEAVIGSILVSGEVCGAVDDWGVSILPDGRLRVQVGDAIQGTVSYPTSLASIPLNTFTHVAITRNTNSNEIQIFINGVLDSPHVSPHNRVLGAMNPTCDTNLHQNQIGIGNLRRQAILSGNSVAFDGIIDEVSFYNRTLSVNEVATIYNAGSAGKCPPVSEPQCVPPPSGLVGWWKGGGGTTDAVGTNNGALVGNASFAPGVVGQAFSFDGDNDSVMIGNPATLQLQNFTIEAWIKRASTNQVTLDTTFLAGTIFGYGYGGYTFVVSMDGRLAFGKVGISGINSTNTIRDTNWHHVAVTKSSASVTFYVDGVGEAAPQYDPGFDFISSVQVGASQWDGTRPTASFLGSIDEVSVYNRALVAAELQSVYLAREFGKCPPVSEPQCVPPPSAMVGWWKGDGVTTDAVGTNNGAFVGNASFVPGVVGQAFSFDGVNDSVMIGNPAALQLQNFTIEALIKRTSTNQVSLDPGYTVGHIFGYGYGGYALAQVDDGRLTLGHVGFSAVYSTQSIRDTNWHHVAVSKASGTVTFYVDGLGDTSQPYDPGFYFTSSAQIGASQWDGTRPTGSYLGSIDEVSVYSRALSASEIASIHAARSEGKCPPPPPITEFANGSFESPTLAAGASVNLPPGSTTALTGWTVGNTGLVSFVNGPALGVNPVQGLQHIGFNGSDTAPGGSISQTFGTTVGQTYAVGFYVGRIGTGSGTLSLHVAVAASNGQILGSLDATAPASPGYGPAQTFTFTAATEISTLKFTDTSSATIAADVLLDNVTVTIIPACVAPPAGLVSWWQGQGDAGDWMGRNGGSLIGGVTFTNGMVGQAFSFDGIDDFVSIAASHVLDVGKGTGLTIDCWIKPTDVSIARPLLEWDNNTGQPFGVHFWISETASGDGSGSLYANLVDTTGIYHQIFSSGGIIGTASFQHVALTYDKTTGAATIYYNGAAVATQNLGIFTPQTSGPLYIGERHAGLGAGSVFQGLMDEISIYNRALSAAEIQSIYVSASYGKCPLPTPIFVSIGPASGFYTNAVTVTLDATSTNATVRYTLDGTVPSTNSPVYAAPFALTDTATVSARAFTNGIPASEVAVSTFRFWRASSGCVAPAGAISWWTADGNVQDVLGLNPGTLVGNTTFVPGRIGQAFSFDGEQDAIVIGNPPSLQLQTFTIETWLRRASTNQVSVQSALFGEILGYGAGGYVFGLRSDGRLFLSKNGVSAVDSTKTVTDTQWHHVAVTKSGSTVVFYVDGVWDSPVTYTDVFTFSSNLEIGAVNDTFDASFLGLIDELAIYGRALATNEIQSVFNSGVSGKCPTFVPIIITAPQNRTVPAGGNTSFSVTAGGSPTLSYQWALNGSPIPDATNAVLAVASVTSTNAGTYTVTVSNGFAPPATASATLTVSVPPAITQQPRSQSVLIGSTATFTVGYTGTPPLTFQWRRNGTLIAGGSSPTLVINNVQSANAGTYTVRISNALNLVLSDPATLTVASGQFSTLTPTTNGIQLNVQGELGGNYIIETSSDLKQWDPLATLLNNPQNWQFTDTSASGVSQRFYRLRRSP